MVRDNMPTEEADWAYDDWAKDLLDEALFAGPLSFRTYTGTW